MIIKFKLFENQQDVDKLYDFCINNLDLENAKLSKEYYYNSITSCVIDAVFSIGINYSQTRKVVERYNEYYNLKLFRELNSDYSSINEQDPLSKLIERTEEKGFDNMASEVYRNRCRSSTHPSSILKSEAVYLFAKTLNKFGINYYQDLTKFIGNEELEKEIRKIPGQGSGISLDYFYMLAGDDTFIKVDRMLIRFIKDAIGYAPDKYEYRKMIIEVCKKLGNITPRALDYQIWSYQRIK